MARIHNEYKDKVTVIGIHPPGFPLKKIQRFFKRYKPPIPYMVAIDDNSALLQTYQVTVLPRTILINRQGKVLYDHLGFETEKEKEIENEILSKL